MYAILFRTLILYLLVSLVMRAMGKRQVGELETSELVSTLLLSQLAALPIEDSEIPLSHVLLPILLIVALEILITFLKSRFNFLKRILGSRPSILIDRGRIDQKEMGRIRLTVEELMSEIRQQGYRDIGDIYYAILEENGRFSLLPRTACEPVSLEAAGKTPKERGCAFALVCDGVIDHTALRRAKRDEGWLRAVCRREGTSPEELFLFTMDETGAFSLTRKEGHT